ncbi:MAG TPA: substrate-binding domain-containing protein [Gemmatimonadaceae bacterium]|nr:substrate-binding domain-containing protein [Gemmatimonadaceae bacterium]
MYDGHDRHPVVCSTDGPRRGLSASRIRERRISRRAALECMNVAAWSTEWPEGSTPTPASVPVDRTRMSIATSRVPGRRRLVVFALGAAAAAGTAGTLPAQTQAAAPAETLFVYGPGGPLPAMKEAAAAFGRRHGVQVEVVAGPTPQWLAKARNDADVIFSGAEHMMTDFVRQLGDTSVGGPRPGRIDEATIRPLYLRPVAILVRPGNPKRIRRFEDLLRPGTKVLVVQGAGQTGLWEDVAGRTGDIRVVRAFRRNIGAFAANSGEAKERWTSDSTFDAWLIWNIWQVANPAVAEVVPVAERWRVYRDAGVALTMKGRERAKAREFVTFLESPAGARIFARWGWMTGTPAR